MVFSRSQPAENADTAKQDIAAVQTETAQLEPAPAPRTITLAQSETSKPLPVIPQGCATSEPAPGSIVIGDRLQLRFFATVAVPRTAEGGGDAIKAEPVAFERLDLSGTYEVGEDGSAALPLIGRVALAGQALSCAEAVIANAIALQDASVSAVTAAYSFRLPVTVSGAVRAPGAYSYSPGMTVDRLLNLSGATFSDGPITPQEFEGLLAQRDELMRRQITATLEMRRSEAVLAGRAELELSDSVLAEAPPEIINDLVATESAALTQDIAVTKMNEVRRAVEVDGLKQKMADLEKQLALVSDQLGNLQSRLDEVATLKSKGLLQASQLDTLISNVMELNRIQLQLQTDRSNLTSQLALASQDAGLEVQKQRQELSRHIAELAGQISLLEVQRQAIDSRLAAHGIGTQGEDRILPLQVSIQRTEPAGAYRFDATWQTPIFPGDMVNVSLPPNTTGKEITASSFIPDSPGSSSDPVVKQ